MKTTSYKQDAQFTDFIADLYPELTNKNLPLGTNHETLTRTFTFQVTDRCNLKCSYCYQINKSTRAMKFEYAKKAIDDLLACTNGFEKYISPDISPAVILDFIGGEPTLEIELIDQIIDYFREQAILLDHPWAAMFCASICSNGVLWNTPEVQNFIKKHRDHLSLSVTIDGDKELHDSCRVFPDGTGSYELAVKAAEEWMAKGGDMGSKITIAPGNVKYLSKALKHMISLGYDVIHANCVYEKGWELEHAQELYRQMKDYADYVIDNDLVNDIYCSLFEEESFHPKAETDNRNWCGGLGDMLALDPDGNYYPCIRYMESSLGPNVKPLCIGNYMTGPANCGEGRHCIECMLAVDRRTQSTDECFYCPIAEGCSWCSGYNYQDTGSFNKRATYICIMHKARALGNAYYWNTWYRKRGLPYRHKLYVPKEWAEEIVGAEEYKKLLNLSNSTETSIEQAYKAAREYAKFNIENKNENAVNQEYLSNN